MRPICNCGDFDKLEYKDVVDRSDKDCRRYDHSNYYQQKNTDIIYSYEDIKFLEECHLQFADLRNADLRNAHFEGADLCGANLEGVDLRGVDLRRVKLRKTWFW